MKNKSTFFTVGLIIITIFVVFFDFSDITLTLPFMHKSSSYTISSGDTIEIGKDYNPGYYNIVYKNADSQSDGEFVGYKFKDGDTLRGIELSKGNSIYYQVNGGTFFLQETELEEEVSEIKLAGHYYIKSELPLKEFEVCNNENIKVDFGSIQLAENKCTNIDFKKLEEDSIEYIAVSIGGDKDGNPIQTAKSLDISLKEINEE